MEDRYNLKEAMALLGFMSVNAFRQLTRKYPNVFVNMNPGGNRQLRPWYDKAALDKFAETYKKLKQVNHGHR